MTKRPGSQISPPEMADDEFLPPTPEQVEYLRKQQHPYAKLSVTARGSNTTSDVRTPSIEYAAKGTLSKKEFDFETRRILGFYVPGVRRGALPPHYRDFLARNLKRNGFERFKVLEQLRKYDLSDVPGVESHFNREKEELTEAKLRQIERAAGVED
jgi:hypothetical protein